MPASPWIRLTLSDGTTLHRRGNEWAWSPGSTTPRFRTMYHFAPGQTIQPDYPDGPVFTIVAKEVLPYANSKQS